MPNEPMRDYLTTAEAAEHLGISRQTLYTWLEHGLPTHQPAGERGRRRFYREELDAWLRSRCSETEVAA